MKVLVTGGCGYIGSHTVLDLLSNGYEIVCVDDLRNSSAQPLLRIQQLTKRTVPLHEVDVCDLSSIRGVFAQHKDIEAVIHFAAERYVNESTEQPIKYYTNNTTGLLNLLKCVEEFGVSNFVFSSSCSVYGSDNVPPVTEETPYSQAESPYALTKQIGEILLKDYIRYKALSVGILRYFNPAGAHPSGIIGEESPIAQNLVPLIVKAAQQKTPISIFGTDYPTRDGTCIRDYIHICDLAKAHTLTLQYLVQEMNLQLGKSGNSIEINVSTGEGTTVKEALDAFEKVTGEHLIRQEVPRRKGDVVSIYANYDKAKKQLGWTPQYTIEDIMKTAWIFANKQQHIV